MKNTSPVYQLKLTVKNIKPVIWRRILVNPNINLLKLHRVIQILMGWYDYHLYEFRIGETRYSPPHEDDFSEKPKSIKTKLCSLLDSGTTHIIYEYDFGDGWKIQITLEKIIMQEKPIKTVCCIAGARSGPLEDSGGPYGYQEKLEILQNPNHEGYKELKDWVGPYFEPERFEIEEINESLRTLR